MERNLINRLSLWALFVAIVLMIPFFANWPWTGSDFVFGAVVMFGFATLFEFLAKRYAEHSALIGIAVFLVFAFVWVFAATGFEGVIDRLN